MTDGHAQRGALALLLEVASTPTMGNVDRERDLPGLRFEHFLAGAVGSIPGLERAAAGGPVGEGFELAVEGMADQRGGNTQFGALLLLVPLVHAAAAGPLTPNAMRSVIAETTVADARSFYRAFDHVDVSVDDLPADVDDDLDVRRGSAAIPAVEAGSITLSEIMATAASKDDVAREWTTGFPRSFAAARMLQSGDGSLLERGARTHLSLLADRPDTLIEKEHGSEIARSVQRLAIEHRDRENDGGQLARTAEELISAGINPGTTADILAAGFFIALEAGEPV